MTATIEPAYTLPARRIDRDRARPCVYCRQTREASADDCDEFDATNHAMDFPSKEKQSWDNSLFLAHFYMAINVKDVTMNRANGKDLAGIRVNNVCADTHPITHVFSTEVGKRRGRVF